MARVQRPPIKANIGAKTARLDEPLRRIMATLAEAHERAEPESIHITTMRLNMIADCGRLDDAALETELAQWVLEQLVPSDSSPASGVVPPIPFRRSAADAHG
jgi:hypothetical protein